MLRGFYLQLYFNGSPAPVEVMDAIISLSITSAANSTSGFQLQLSTAKVSRLLTDYLPSGFFDPVVTRVQIVVVISGQTNVLFDGLIARQEIGPSSEPGASTLTVTGEDLTLAMNLVDLTGLPYPGFTVEAMVGVNLAPFLALGLIPEVIPSVFVDVPNPLSRVTTHVGTSLAFIKYLAAQVGYVFYLTPTSDRGVNHCYWGPEIRWGETQPALTINSDAHTNVDSLSFSYDGTSAKLFAFMVQIPNTSVSIPIPVPNVGVLRPPLVSRQPIPFKLELLRDSHRLGPIRAAGLALAKSAQAADAVTGQGTLNVLRYGRILKSRSLVDVRGAGFAYDGTYYVKSVTHSIKRGEYKQNFSLVREGTVPLKSSVTV
jgi:hypothetical protein